MKALLTDLKAYTSHFCLYLTMHNKLLASRLASELIYNLKVLKEICTICSLYISSLQKYDCGQ